MRQTQQVRLLIKSSHFRGIESRISINGRGAKAYSSAHRLPGPIYAGHVFAGVALASDEKRAAPEVGLLCVEALQPLIQVCCDRHLLCWDAVCSCTMSNAGGHVAS